MMFPKLIYAAIVENGAGVAYLSVKDDPLEFAELNTSIRVACYSLVSVGHVEANAQHAEGKRSGGNA